VGISKKGNGKLNLISSSQWLPAARKREVPTLVEMRQTEVNGSSAVKVSRMLIHIAAISSLLLLNSELMAQGDSIPPKSGMAQADSVSQKSGTSPVDSISKNTGLDTTGLTNIVLAGKNIKAYGWGEYKVGGRCLCCDNLLDGDCIIVHSTNRTERLRVKQIIDGKIEADTNDRESYFGDVQERENPVPVNLLMAEITLNKTSDIYKIIVYTILEKDTKKSFLSNCDLGYTDQFDRLQWHGKVENKGDDDHISFVFEKPILTKSILLKVKDGRNKITEVAIFCRTKKE
jgi:hypothetical protein